MIPNSAYEVIKNIDVNEHSVICKFETWLQNFSNNQVMTDRIKTIQSHLGSMFNREDIVRFYKISSIEMPTKFLAAMIWGYEAPSGSQRAGYGPSRVKEMFADIDNADRAINSVDVKTPKNIETSYKKLSRKGVLPKCGPNFFTKHFYFLGKSIDLIDYPLIFDDRVAKSLLGISLNNSDVIKMISATTIRTPGA